EEEAADALAPAPEARSERGGEPQTVKYPDGMTAEIKRDEKGQPTNIEFSNGYKLEKQPDGTWNGTQDGKEVTKGIKDVSVKPDGTISQTDGKNNVRDIHPDGTSTLTKPNG